MVGSGRLGHRHFNLDKQRALIRGHGVTCLVQPTVSCPCITYEQQFDPLCGRCRGTGRWPQASLEYTVTLAMIQEDSRRQYHEPGSWTEGSILCITPPEVTLAERDLIRVLDVKDIFDDEVLQKGVLDRVRFQAGVDIEIIVDYTRTYVPDVDYMLVEPNEILWLPGGNAPLESAWYSIRYRAYPEYLVFLDTPRLRAEFHTPQSQEVKLLRLDKIMRA
jgi:hypothetical protein